MGRRHNIIQNCLQTTFAQKQNVKEKNYYPQQLLIVKVSGFTTLYIL